MNTNYKEHDILIEDDIEKEDLRKVLRDLSIQEAIIDLLSKEIGKATVEIEPS